MKLFTVEEANALLPTVRGIVRRIQRAYACLSAVQEQARELICDAEAERDEVRRTEEFDETVPRLVPETAEDDEHGPKGPDFIRVTDDQ